MGGDFFVVAMIFFVLRCAIETATGSFFRYRTGFFMGLMGLDGETKWQKF